MELPVCSTAEEVASAYADWLASVSYGGGCNAMLSDDAGEAPDNCGGSITVTWTVTSTCEDDVTASATFSVAPDLEAPVITLPSIDELCNDEFPEMLTASWTDNCAGEGTLDAYVSNIMQFECYQTADYVFSVTDDCNNTSTETFTLTRYYDQFENCETAFGRYEGNNTCFIGNGFNRWGWTNYLESEGDYTFDLYAGAAHCDTSNGAYVGEVLVSYADGYMTVTYDLFEGYVLNEAHVYIGCDPYPTLPNGNLTVAPGQYTFNTGSLDHVYEYTIGPVEVSGPVYVIVHGVTCEEICRCSVSEDNGGVYDTSGTSIDCGPQMLPRVSDDFTAYPVPFNNELFVNYSFDYQTDVTIELFDMKGARIRVIEDNSYIAGTEKTAKLDTSRLDEQMYVLRMTTDKGVITKKVVSYSKQ